MADFDTALSDAEGYLGAVDPTIPNPSAMRLSQFRANFLAIKNTLTKLRDIAAILQSAILLKADSSAIPTNTDQLSDAGRTNQFFTAARVYGAGISAFTAAAGTILIGDTLQTILQKLQGNINAKQAELGFTPEDAAYRNSPDGYAGLDSSGHVYISQLPDSILHTLKFKGVFNGSSITSGDTALNGLSAIPAASSANDGNFIIATGSFTAYGIDYITGDWLISIGTSWQKIDNTDSLSSWNGRLGAVFLLATDISDVFVALAAKTALVDGDSLAVLDSGAGNVLKKATLANLYAYLKAKFDAVYQPLLVSGSNLRTVNGESLLGSSNLVVSGGGGYQSAVLSFRYNYSSTTTLSPANIQQIFSDISGLSFTNTTAPFKITLPAGTYRIALNAVLHTAGRLITAISLCNPTAPPYNSYGTGGYGTVFQNINNFIFNSAATTSSDSLVIIEYFLTLNTSLTFMLGNASSADSTLTGTGFNISTSLTGTLAITKLA
ncbi:hypothetical protein [Methylovulum psychrotolerans]|uniref:Uncharacterized protein n=1 Tax=Methylovulum psychrotolerans TaxID=1704499 RepID=A0A1Z4BV77_9GAMM|nr:hypothetical protein [Methylovulum psychrotolerans]ASF45214.1 hypothetical protein CEK71_03580 [Methylovulum psychrotolerans]